MISNPYAKKRKVATASAHSNRTGADSRASEPAALPNTTSHHASTAAILAPNVAETNDSLRNAAPATFSQAFESVEDSAFYQEQFAAANEGEQTSRAAQRAFEQSPSAAAANTNDRATTQQQPISDRDHHVFLQQPHVLYVSIKQRGNGCLQYIRNVPVQFQKMVPDYIFSTTSCALFLSVKYHTLHPDYIHGRLAAVRSDFAVRILLVLVDASDCATVLLELNKLCVTRDWTLLLAWSETEAARYLETLKAVDGKDAGSIKKPKDSLGFADQVADVLTTVKGFNKTDAGTALAQFGSMRAVMAATPDELGLIPGLGQVKIKRLRDAFHKPFSSKAARERKLQREESLQQTAAAAEDDTLEQI